MDFTINNTLAARVTATVAILAMVAGILSPMTSNVAQAAVAPSCTVVSDSSTQVGGSNSVVTSGIPGTWSTISGADWIWEDANFMNAPAGSKTFTKKFIVNGTSTIANLMLAADNGYTVKVNSTIVGSTGTNDGINSQFTSVTNIDILSALIMNAENTIEITVTNYDGPGNNPAGLIYKIEMTGNTCDPLPIDQCSNIAGMQATVPAGYEGAGDTCVPTTITDGTTKDKSCVNRGENLIQNGSFEDPAIGGGYFVVATVANWISSSLDGFEIWRNQNGPASAGAQHLELDVNTPTTISQAVPTTIGNVYQVMLDFSPRNGGNAADNKVEVAVGSALGSVSADGSAYAANVWTTHNFQFTAASTSSLLELRDKGTANGLGSLVDNVKVCLVKDNTPVIVPTHTISGFKFNDANADGIFTNDESKLAGWEIALTDNMGVVTYDTTDSDGNYLFSVANGSYQVTETGQKGWEQTATIGDGADGPICYVTASDSSGEIGGDERGRFVGSFGPQTYTCDFGNHEITERRNGGSSSGTRVKRTPTGEVFGASTSTPTGVVLGEATTTMPVGAPNTGAGGTSPISASLPTLVAILSITTRKSK